MRLRPALDENRTSYGISVSPTVSTGFRSQRTSRIGRVKQCWIAGCGWMPREGARG